MPHAAARTGGIAFAGLVTLSALVVLGGTAGAAGAATPEVTAREPVFGGLTHERFRVELDDGRTARGDVLRVDTTAEHLEVRPALARDRIVGLETMRDLDSRARTQGALAGTNGGYWIDLPSGAPNGLYVEGGRTLAGEARLGLAGNRRARSSVGFLPAGELVMDLLEVDLHLDLPDGSRIDVDDLNRLNRSETTAPRSATGEILLYDHRYGGGVDLPSGSVVARLDRLDPTVEETTTATVRTVEAVASATSVEVREGESLLLAHGSRAGDLSPLTPGAQVALTVRVRAEATSASTWQAAAEALPGGPLVVRDGQRTSVDSWRQEAFSDSHLTGRQPRTAIARGGGDQILLITVDGRREGHSVGMTLIELAETAIALGATDVLNLDGGGSTTMTIEGRIANRPSESGRSIANGLFVYSDYPFAGSRRLSGPDRYATAAAIAHASHPEGADTALLAVGEHFPDALAGGPLASAIGAPLLLSRSDQLPEATSTALIELGVDSVTLLGGPAAIDDVVPETLESLGIAVTRAAGEDRYATAASIAGSLVGDAPLERVFLAAGRDFPDALTAAGAAGALGAPVLLTETDALPEATAAFLAGRPVEEIVVVGGQVAISPAVADAARDAASARLRRLAGADRFATAVALNRWAAGEIDDLDDTELVVAQGRDFPDALAGGPLAAARRQLLMIVPPADVDAAPAVADYLAERAGGLAQVTLIGGPAVLSNFQHYQLDQYALR